MKVLQVVVGILVLVIAGISAIMLYSQLEVLSFYSENQSNVYGLELPNEFYIVFISTIVLLIFSLPTIIYQTKKIFIKKTTLPVSDDLIDDDDIEIQTKTPTHNKFLYGTTKLYAFALLTQVILLGKRLSTYYNNLESISNWMIFSGFMLAAFVAIYFLSVDKATD